MIQWKSADTSACGVSKLLTQVSLNHYETGNATNNFKYQSFFAIVIEFYVGQGYIMVQNVYVVIDLTNI